MVRGRAPIVRSACVARRSKMQRAEAFGLHVGNEVRVFGAGVEWCLPREAEPFLQALAAHDRFVAEDVLTWDSTLRWIDAEALLCELVEGGLVEVIDG